MLGKQFSASRGIQQKTVELTRRPAGIPFFLLRFSQSSVSLCSECCLYWLQEEKEAKVKAEKIRIAMEKMAEASIKKVKLIYDVILHIQSFLMS